MTSTNEYANCSARSPDLKLPASGRLVPRRRPEALIAVAHLAHPGALPLEGPEAPNDSGRGAYDDCVILDRLDITAEAFEDATGWQIKPEGACRADFCVPLPAGGFDLTEAADRLGMAVVAEPSLGLWSVGPETLGGRALVTADASDFSLPDLDGNTVRITSLRNQKVLVVAWAPY